MVYKADEGSRWRKLNSCLQSLLISLDDKLNIAILVISDHLNLIQDSIQ